jgi:hypothetical protein
VRVKGDFGWSEGGDLVKKRDMKLTTIVGLGILMMVASACEQHPASELPKTEKHGEAGHEASGKAVGHEAVGHEAVVHEGSVKAEVKPVAAEK